MSGAQDLPDRQQPRARRGRPRATSMRVDHRGARPPRPTLHRRRNVGMPAARPQRARTAHGGSAARSQILFGIRWSVCDTARWRPSGLKLEAIEYSRDRAARARRWHEARSPLQRAAPPPPGRVRQGGGDPASRRWNTRRACGPPPSRVLDLGPGRTRSRPDRSGTGPRRRRPAIGRRG